MILIDHFYTQILIDHYLNNNNNVKMDKQDQIKHFIVGTKQPDDVHENIIVGYFNCPIEKTLEEVQRFNLINGTELLSDFFLDEDEGKIEFNRILNKRAMDYTKLLRTLPDLSLVKDRNFFVYLDEDITYFPGAYKMDIEMYNKLLKEFPSVRLADENDTIRSVIVSKDKRKLQELKLPFGSFCWLKEEFQRHEKEELIYYTIANLVGSVKDVVKCSYILSKGNTVVSRASCIREMEKISFRNKDTTAEQFVDMIISNFKDDPIKGLNFEFEIDTRNGSLTVQFGL